MVCKIISLVKANRLFWLGRYSERVYLSLHFLRRYYDIMLDCKKDYYTELRNKLDTDRKYSDNESFILGLMYDQENPCSILSCLTAANDNAIVLREEITSESLSYIQLSIEYMKCAAKMRMTNITDLQCVTDNLLAFWGSIGERVLNDKILNILKTGKLIENLDMYVRYDYSFSRIKDVFEKIYSCAMHDGLVFNSAALDNMKELLLDPSVAENVQENKYKLLTSVNNLVNI